MSYSHLCSEEKQFSYVAFQGVKLGNSRIHFYFLGRNSQVYHLAFDAIHSNALRSDYFTFSNAHVTHTQTQTQQTKRNIERAANTVPMHAVHNRFICCRSRSQSRDASANKHLLVVPTSSAWIPSSRRQQRAGSAHGHSRDDKRCILTEWNHSHSVGAKCAALPLGIFAGVKPNPSTVFIWEKTVRINPDIGHVMRASQSDTTHALVLLQASLGLLRSTSSTEHNGPKLHGSKQPCRWCNGRYHSAAAEILIGL